MFFTTWTTETLTSYSSLLTDASEKGELCQQEEKKQQKTNNKTETQNPQINQPNAKQTKPKQNPQTTKKKETRKNNKSDILISYELIT